MNNVAHSVERDEKREMGISELAVALRQVGMAPKSTKKNSALPSALRPNSQTPSSALDDSDVSLSAGTALAIDTRPRIQTLPFDVGSRC